MKLYTYPNNKNAFKALVAAQYVGAKIEVPPFQMGVDNKSAEFLKKNPFGKVPTLETPNGSIFESNAIARYVARLAEKGLMGTTPVEAALVEQWIDFSTNEIDAPLLSWVLPLMGVWPADKKKEDAAKEALKKALGVLNSTLESRTYLVGDRVTLADIIAACNLYLGFTKVFDAGFRKDYPNVERYFTTLVNQPQFKTVFGEVALCKTPITAPKEGAKPKEAPKPKEEKPKEEKPKEAPKPAPKAEDEEAAGADEEKKAKAAVDSWLATLPQSNMQLDGWKRLYSNAPANNFRAVAVGGLWNGAPVPNSPSNEVFPGFDKNAFSWWFCNYKFPEENTVNFIVMNKVGGFLQRVDYARKYAFGVMCILKDSNGTMPIRGAWCFRGQDLPPQMLSECYDMELYEWTKVDLDNAEQKKRLEDMLCEEAKIDGIENIEVKVFK